MADITEFPNVDDIALFLQHEHGISSEKAHIEAQQVIEGFQDMASKGFIKGWYFDHNGHLSLLPCDGILPLLK